MKFPVVATSLTLRDIAFRTNILLSYSEIYKSIFAKMDLEYKLGNKQFVYMLTC